MVDDTLGTTDGDVATGDGDPGGAHEPKSPHGILELENEVELRRRASEMEPGSLKTEAEPVGLRI